MKKVRPKRLGDLLNLKRGYDLPESKRNEGSYPVISSAGISGYHNEYKVEGEGVVIGRYGTLGDAHYIEGRYWPHNTSLYVTDFKGNYPRYIYYLLTCIGRIKTSDKSAVPGVNRNELHEMAVPAIDDIRLQKKIAHILSTLDAKIELNKRINEELEGMAKLLYDYWFVQFDFPITATQAAAMGDPALEGKPYRQSGGKMVYNETLKREIPDGWNGDELNQCVSAILDHRGKTPKKLGGDWSTKDDAIIALSAKIVKGGKLVGLERANKVDKELFDKWMPSKLMDGDILMTSEAPAGELYFIHGKTDYCLSQRLFGIRANPAIVTPAYLYHELSVGNAFYQIQGSLSGSTVFGIRQDVLRTIKVVIPDRDTLQAFEGTVIPLMKQIKVLDRQNQHLSELRDWLLPMLMNGQVTVG